MSARSSGARHRPACPPRSRRCTTAPASPSATRRSSPAAPSPCCARGTPRSSSRWSARPGAVGVPRADARPDAPRARRRRHRVARPVQPRHPLLQRRRAALAAQAVGDGGLPGRAACTSSTARPRRGIVTNLRPADQRRKPGSVGHPWYLTELRVVDDAGQPGAARRAGRAVQPLAVPDERLPRRRRTPPRPAPPRTASSPAATSSSVDDEGYVHDRRPQEGPDHLRRGQRLPARGRGGPADPPGRRRGRGRRRARRDVGRGGRRRTSCCARRHRSTTLEALDAHCRAAARRASRCPATCDVIAGAAAQRGRARSSSASCDRPMKLIHDTCSDLSGEGHGQCDRTSS